MCSLDDYCTFTHIHVFLLISVGASALHYSEVDEDPSALGRCRCREDAHGSLCSTSKEEVGRTKLRATFSRGALAQLCFYSWPAVMTREREVVLRVLWRLGDGGVDFGGAGCV
jgi:hypothetical protein